MQYEIHFHGWSFKYIDLEKLIILLVNELLDISSLSSQKVVDAYDFMSLVKKTLTDVTSNEASPARY